MNVLIFLQVLILISLYTPTCDGQGVFLGDSRDIFGNVRQFFNRPNFQQFDVRQRYQNRRRPFRPRDQFESRFNVPSGLEQLPESSTMESVTVDPLEIFSNIVRTTTPTVATTVEPSKPPDTILSDGFLFPNEFDDRFGDNSKKIEPGHKSATAEEPMEAVTTVNCPAVVNDGTGNEPQTVIVTTEKTVRTVNGLSTTTTRIIGLPSEEEDVLSNNCNPDIRIDAVVLRSLIG